ncbi:type II secretion system protein [Thiorhodospira sibirica]|uniref:type II secretion system protein n=1 Tax=Thiorhodospira sibirica TaxID=154347 RepID=UPI00022C11D0|nr:type II secretion system protein [Thiorhodospira sibirica]
MSARSSGFTLIEVVIVIVLLGILTAMVMPRFVNLTGEARDSALDATAAAIGAAMAMNYANCRINPLNQQQCQWVNGCNAASVLRVMNDGTVIVSGEAAIPANGYAVSDAPDNNDESTERRCILTNHTGQTQTFTAFIAEPSR